MTNPNPWNHLRYGDAQRGLALIEEACRNDTSASRIMQLGIAYLWSGRYERAWQHFQHAMVTYHQTVAHFYGMAGTAKWCLDEPKTSVEWWQIGMQTEYADGAGGIHLPLLMYVASVVRPGTFPRDDVQRILRVKAQDRRADNWPGPLGRFVLGMLDAKALEELGRDVKTGTLPPQYAWLIRFYKAVVDLERNHINQQEFNRFSREISNLSQTATWTDERSFLRLIWNEEFFIARREADGLTQ